MSLLEQIGVDPEDFTWRDLGLCVGTDEPDNFFEEYEHKENVAKNIDDMCLSCPVMKACAEYAQMHRESGVWGGVYWDGSGKPDKERNAHKTPEVWDEIKRRISE
jgi:hypothetical protein